MTRRIDRHDQRDAMRLNHLGKDFWLYRAGQAVSVVGDSCGMIATSWWILEATGSAAKMSLVIAPMMFAHLFITPLLGPLGDRFPRKTLIIIGDIWRGVFCLALAAMVYSGFFNIWAVAVLCILMSAGSALFTAGASGLIPQLVPKDRLQIAMQRSEAVNSGGQILGGALGGILVSAVGVPGAFLIDGISFFVAAGCSHAIAADTKPVGAKDDRHSLALWARQFSGGIRAMLKVPVLLWLGVLAAFINFAFSPIVIGLPVLVKEMRNMPPWFLGALQSAISAGVILGSFVVGHLCKRFRADAVVMSGIVLLGGALAVLPHAPNILLPVFVMLFLGAMQAIVNIPLMTREALATPDNFRSRLGTVMEFLCGAISPLGVAVAGIAISAVGLNITFLVGGLGVALMAPLLLLVPGFTEFLRLPEAEAHEYFKRRHPQAFAE